MTHDAAVIKSGHGIKIVRLCAVAVAVHVFAVHIIRCDGIVGISVRAPLPKSILILDPTKDRIRITGFIGS
jgi:hypothetical protein